MNFTGTFNLEDKSFDIADVSETQTNISVVNNTLRLSYVSPSGQYIQLVKTLETAANVAIGDELTVAKVKDADGRGGFGCKGAGRARALAPVDWSDTSNLTTQTFTDNDGVSRSKVLVPVTFS